MFRTLSRCCAIVAVMGISCAPSAAIAGDAPTHDEPPRTVIIGDHNQVAGHDINNAGRDNNGGSDSPGGPVEIETDLIIVNAQPFPAVLVSHTGGIDAFFPDRIDARTAKLAETAVLPVSAVYQVSSTQVTISLDDDGNPSCTTTRPNITCTIQVLQPGLYHFYLN